MRPTPPEDFMGPANARILSAKRAAMNITTPALLTEIKRPRQIPGELARRWFTSETMDLIVWLDAEKTVQGFQLCYGKPVQERALTWDSGKGFSHLAVDDGSVGGLGHKSTPVLLANSRANPEELLTLFTSASRHLPKEIVASVTTALRQHPDFPHEH